MKFSANNATSVSDGSDTGSATIAVSRRPSLTSSISFAVDVNDRLLMRLRPVRGARAVHRRPDGACAHTGGDLLCFRQAPPGLRPGSRDTGGSHELFQR